MIDLDAISAHGYCVVPFASPEAVAELSALYRRLSVDQGLSFFASANDLERPQAELVSHEINRIVASQLERWFPAHRSFLGSFLVKGPHHGAQISFHQDLSYTNERSARTTVLWLPLIDTTADNGALAVVAGSHRWTTGCRPSGIDPLPTDQHQDLFAAHGVQLEIPAGTAVAYDAATVHGSPSNTSSQVRVAVGIALVPSHEPLVHVHADDHGGFSTFAVDTNYYTQQGLRHRPVGYPQVPAWAQPVAPRDFVDNHSMVTP